MVCDYSIFSDTDTKIQPLIVLKEAIRFLKCNEYKIVFTNGCFDLLHIGHLTSLQFAKKQGDILIVAINSDESVRYIKGRNHPIIDETSRARLIAALQCVNYVIIFNEPTPLKILEELRPHILVKADKEVNILGGEFVDEIRLSPTLNGISTSQLIQDIKCLI